MKHLVISALSGALLASISISCTPKASAPLNNSKELAAIKEQAGIALTTNSIVLKKSDPDSRDDCIDWTVYVKAPEHVTLLRYNGEATNLLKNGESDPLIIGIVESALGRRISNPIATDRSIWEGPVGQSHGFLVQTRDGEYLTLRQFYRLTTPLTNSSKAN